MAVQNGRSRFALFLPDAPGQGLECSNAYSDIPTTEVLVSGDVRIIPNSHLRRYRVGGTLFPPQKHLEMVILKCPLPAA